ncbi:MAG: SusC/RagA family TonB-linked outer membrane protein [Bacteroides sp.]|nr:SusC/RagA family TonB-linked outer membrane protein [Bacteroides sp.]
MVTKRKKIVTGWILLWWLLPGLLLARENRLTGRVIDFQTREAVIGATVSVKNGSTGTITDIDGQFAFALEGEYPVTLDIRAIGYATQELDVYQPGDILIELVESFNRLTEVVVIGYGTQKKSELSGAISSIPSVALQQPLSSVDKALQGVSPGVQVTQTSGQPGGGVSIRVRGGSSIEGSSEPLYVIDGFPVTAGSSSSAGVVSGATINPLSTINPSDIESIDILKDASATAIYGSRGANGVIIITTKRGKEGKSNVVYDGSVGFQSIRKKIDLLNAAEFAQLRNEALYDKTPEAGEYQYLSPEEIARLGKGTDWQDAAFRTALVQNHQVSVTGGTDKIRYAVSGGYFQQEGILIGTDFSRFSGRMNLDGKVSDRFTVGSTVSGSRTHSNVAPSGVINALLTMPPTATIYKEDGSYTLRNPFENIISNPVASLNDQTNRVISFNLLANIFGEYQLYKGLTLKVSLGTDIHYNKENSYIPSTLYEGSTTGGQAGVGTLSAYSWLNENTLNYLTTLQEKHNLNILGGFTQQEHKAETLSAGSQNFVSDDLTYNSLQAGSVITTPGSASQSWALLSYLGRINYNYDGRYFASVSFRADGSSRFGKNNKWGYFPSAALSWRASDESFFPQNGKVSDLKVRVSYGATGNQEIGLYQSLSTLTSVRYLIGDSPVIGFTPARIANDDLGWETTYQFDAGVDVGFFRDRLSLTLDFYYKKNH